MDPIAAVASRIASACYVAGDDLESLRKRLLAKLRRAVPVDAAFFAASDPDTLLFTFAAADEPLVAAGPLFLANEFGDLADVNRFAVLARARRCAATLDEATRGRRAASVRYREVIEPLGLGDELRVALRTGGTTWGFLCLHREGTTGFSPSEVAIVEQVAMHAGEAIRRIVAESLVATDAPAGSVGVILVAADDRVVAITEGAASALADLDDLVVEIGDRLPLRLLAVVRRLEALEKGLGVEAPAALRLSSRRGALLEVQAARLRGDGERGTTAITIAPASANVRSWIQLAAYRLTPAQRRVAALVLQGRSTLQIVAELGIAEYTVQDHLKSIFDKVGVGSRRELVAALMR